MPSADQRADERTKDELAPAGAKWLEPSNVYGTASVAKNLVPLLAFYAAIPYVADRSLVLGWCFSPIVGLVLYRLTMVMHDCGHATLFTTRPANEWVGKALGFITGVDFGRFKQLHWEHHKGYGAPGDPQGFHYLGISRMTRSALTWHVVKPLLGANLRYVFRESILHPSNLKVAASNGELVALALVQIAVALLITGAGRHASLVVLPFVAAATFGLFLSQLRGIAEHGVGEPDRGETFVRSHAPELLGALLLYDVHFNFHEEHHRYPGVPSHQLAAMSRELSRERTMPTIWHTLRTRAR
jgi:fatty acid desaturase